MSVDMLQNRIRKLKSPLVLDLCFDFTQSPPHILEEEPDLASGSRRFCGELLEGLQDVVAAVRFHSGLFSLLGSRGMETMDSLLNLAWELGYYVLLDAPEFSSAQGAETAAGVLFSENCPWKFHGVVVPPYIGSDGLKPFVRGCEKLDKSLFVLTRTANKSAAELQDLLTGTRVVHQVVMESVKRLGVPGKGRTAYLSVGGLVAANAPDRIRTLRDRFSTVFFLLDGMDATGGNASNCRLAFDRMGHGAAVCLSSAILGAWQQGESREFVSAAKAAAENARHKISRYVTIL